MAFLYCKFCSYAGNGSRICPDCNVPMVSDEVPEVPVKVVVSDEMARLQESCVGSALMAVHEAALGVVDGAKVQADDGPRSPRIETDGARLRSLRAKLDAAGGRDVELAEEIDRLEESMRAGSRYVLVHKDHLKTLKCAVKMARAEITGLVFDGGKPCE